MNKILLRTLFVCMLMFPLLGSAAEVTGTLNSYSIKGKVLVVDGVKYFADIENLNITYSGEYIGTDALESGLKVELILNDEASMDSGNSVVRMRILTYKPQLDS